MSNSDELLSTIKLYVLYYEMRELCLSRQRECKECPYYVDNICQKRSTDDILAYCYKIFSEFLADK
jgi:endonuclease III